MVPANGQRKWKDRMLNPIVIPRLGSKFLAIQNGDPNPKYEMGRSSMRYGSLMEQSKNTSKLSIQQENI